jgi:uncharacterized protein YlxW (UPF0749 family)
MNDHKLTKWLSKTANKQKLMLLVLFLLFGIVVSNHISMVQETNKASSLVESYNELQKELNSLTATNEQLQTENQELQQERENVINTVLEREGYDQLSEEISRIRILAGFTEVRGEGVIVTLNDKPDYDPLRDPVASIIHDGNIRHVVNLLINSGAAAVSINGIRVVNTSGIYCIGPTILCNKERMTPPYRISALGPASMMYNAVVSDQVINQLTIPEIGIIANVEKIDEVVIPPFNEADNFEQYINQLEVVKNED